MLSPPGGLFGSGGTRSGVVGESPRRAVCGLRGAWIRAPKGSGSRCEASSTRIRGCEVLCRASRTWPRRLCGLRRGRSRGTRGGDDLGSPKASARVRKGHGEAHQGFGVDGAGVQWRNRSSTGGGRRASTAAIPGMQWSSSAAAPRGYSWPLGGSSPAACCGGDVGERREHGGAGS
jgi:hypothetical protein